MERKYFGMRFAIPSGGSHKVTLPKTLVEEVWRRSSREGFPICFMLMENRVFIEDLDRMLSTDLYPPEILKEVEQDWLEYGWKVRAKKLRELDLQLMRGKINERVYDFECHRIHEAFVNYSKKFRRKLLECGIRLSSMPSIEDLMVSMEILQRKEEEESFYELEENLKKIVNEEKLLASLLDSLEKRFASKEIGEKNYRKLKQLYSNKLEILRDNIRKLRKILCS